MAGHFPHQHKGRNNRETRGINSRLQFSALVFLNANSGFIDFVRVSPILTGERKCGGAAWLRVWRKAGDPLNLMRVMPPKEARLGHAIFRAWLFNFRQN